MQEEGRGGSWWEKACSARFAVPGFGAGEVALICILLAFGFGSYASAVDYYVSSSGGTDTSSGRGTAQAWKTLERVNHASLAPGDSVWLKRGDVWYETLQSPSSGSPGHPITFAAYGRGERPVISGRLQSAKPLTLERSTPGLGLERALSRERHSDDPPELFRDYNIDNHEQSHIIYEGLDLREAREGLRLYSWNKEVRNITLRNCRIASEPSVPHGTMSAGVYANVGTGKLGGIVIEKNVFIPHPRGLETWGIYFVRGVSGFRIENNNFAPAGEDAVTIWHSDTGVIAGNSGGHNGENTIDVKDSHDIVIKDNRAEDDGEYNIVVHGVDSADDTFNMTVERNRCLRAGQGGQLTSGIAILFAKRIRLAENSVDGARGAGIFENDGAQPSHNEIRNNWLRRNGTRQSAGAITLERPSAVDVTGNLVEGQGSDGFAVRVEGESQWLHIRENRLDPGSANMIQLTFAMESGRERKPLHSHLLIDNNRFYSTNQARFQDAQRDYSLAEWRHISGQDRHSQWLRDGTLATKSLASEPARTPQPR
jgi:hypothetical protein